MTSLSKPGGNVTGVSILINLLSSKRLELLHSLLPKAPAIAVLMNPKARMPRPDLKETEAAAKALGLTLKVCEASTEQEIETAFAGYAKEGAAALFVIADGFFRNQSGQIVALAARYSIPASYPWAEFTDAGGLIGYGVNSTEARRQGGIYVGRILKGEKPADLPVMQADQDRIRAQSQDGASA